MTSVGAGAEPILRLAMGYMASTHLFLANAVGVFEHLAHTSADLDELAAGCALPRRTVQKRRSAPAGAPRATGGSARRSSTSFRLASKR